jgi:hypothetical protein
MLFSREALVEIDNIVKKPSPALLRARMVANLKVARDKSMDSFRFFWYTPEGSAEVFKIGQFASNIPIVGAKGGNVTVDGFTIANAFPMSDSEIFASNKSKERGLTPDFQVEQNRIADSRDFLYRQENRTFFLGNSVLGMTGLLNFSKTMTVDGQSKNFTVQSEDVVDGASAAAGDAKKYWKNKTAEEIVKDILTGVQKVRSIKVNGEPIFEPNTLLIPDMLYTRLIQPYSASLPNYSILKYLEENRIFQNVYVFPELNKAYTGFSHDCFVVMDNRPSVVELGLFHEPEVHPEESNSDGAGNHIIPVRMKTAGCMLYHPSGVYVGKKIGDGTV